VTRGDVNLRSIVDSLPYGEVVIWDNSKRHYDAKVYGRYLGIAEATNRVIFFQDDDCILSAAHHQLLLDAYEPGVVVGSMPYPDPMYQDTTLLGWGALFDRELPEIAFRNYNKVFPVDDARFREEECEYVFPMLSRTKTVYADPSRMIDGEQVELRPNRMWRREEHYGRLFTGLYKARLARDRLIERNQLWK